MAEPLALIRQLLVAAAPVVALVGDRVSPNPVKQGVPVPAIALRVVSTVPNTHLRGDGHLDEVRVQLDCHAATRAAAFDLARKARAALDTAATPITDEFEDFDEFSDTHVFTQDYLVFIDPTA